MPVAMPPGQTILSLFAPGVAGAVARADEAAREIASINWAKLVLYGAAGLVVMGIFAGLGLAIADAMTGRRR